VHVFISDQLNKTELNVELLAGLIKLVGKNETGHAGFIILLLLLNRMVINTNPILVKTIVDQFDEIGPLGSSIIKEVLILGGDVNPRLDIVRILKKAGATLGREKDGGCNLISTIYQSMKSDYFRYAGPAINGMVTSKKVVTEAIIAKTEILRELIFADGCKLAEDKELIEQFLNSKIPPLVAAVKQELGKKQRAEMRAELIAEVLTEVRAEVRAEFNKILHEPGGIIERLEALEDLANLKKH
jgi:hypothetical protein